MNREDVKQTMLLAMSEHHSGNIEEARRIVDAQLDALEAAGVRLVPVEATGAAHDMIAAGLDACSPLNHGSDMIEVEAFYEATIAASPYAPEQKDETK